MTTLKTLNIPFDLSVVAKGAPLSSAIYENCSDLTSYIEDQFYYPSVNKGEMPYYVFTEAEVKEVCEASESVYGALVDSLELLFDKYSDKIPYFFGEEFIGKYPEFLEYAKYTYRQNHEAIYGRFDVAFDFATGKVKGFYELNGDTPVMLFESSYMQDYFATQAGQREQQSNIWYENLKLGLRKVLAHKENPNVGIFVCIDAIEDALTGEHLYWSLQDECNCYIYNMEDIHYDFVKEKPFHVGDIEFDFVFILQPWEEMMENSPDIINKWRNWGRQVRFGEPAWRWFVSNKGSLAWIWWLLNESGETEFVEEHKKALDYLLPTYMTPNGMSSYVQKPLTGRLSNNIKIFKDGKNTYSTDGFYEDSPVVYQEYCEPTSVDATRGKSIIGVWMSPYGDSPLVMEASTICLREFDLDVNDIGNERFIPHLVE